MSDKRATPDPARAAPRRKRAAPTIDLTATEVSAGSNERPSSPQEQPAATAESKAAAEPERPETAAAQAEARGPEPSHTAGTNSSLEQPVWRSVPVLAGGLLGAAVAAIALGALWFAGALPVRHVASSDNQAVEALAERVTKIESLLAKLPPSEPNVSDRLAAADNAMKSLGIALTALAKRSDEIASNAGDARVRADAAERAVAQLRDNVQNLTRNSSGGLSAADVETIQKRLAALEQAGKKPIDDVPARRALIATALRDAVASGKPFASELEQAKSLGADGNTLTPLVPFATTGLPTADALAQELRALIPTLRNAASAEMPTGSLLERLQANAGKLVRIRPVDAPPGDDRSAIPARIEAAAAHADIDGALADLLRLGDAARAPAREWIAKAQARQAALVAARQFAAESARTLGKQ